MSTTSIPCILETRDAASLTSKAWINSSAALLALYCCRWWTAKGQRWIWCWEFFWLRFQSRMVDCRRDIVVADSGSAYKTNDELERYKSARTSSLQWNHLFIVSKPGPSLALDNELAAEKVLELEEQAGTCYEEREKKGTLRQGNNKYWVYVPAL